jgi:lysophospholipase L1-like esterase
MKKILTLSVVINLIFVLFMTLLIHKKGGIQYIRSKIGLESSYRPVWYYKNNLYWQEKKTLFEILPKSPNEIVFIGNSLTDGCEWAELFNNHSIKNRGIAGDNTEGVLERISDITKSLPDKIFLEIGINDLGIHLNTYEICRNYKLIIEKIRLASPDTKIYLQSLLPTFNHNIVSKDSVVVLNHMIKTVADDYSLIFINLYNDFLDEKGYMNMKFSFDGVHLNGQGYLLWKQLIENYI